MLRGTNSAPPQRGAQRLICYSLMHCLSLFLAQITPAPNSPFLLHLFMLLSREFIYLFFLNQMTGDNMLSSGQYPNIIPVFSPTIEISPKNGQNLMECLANLPPPPSTEFIQIFFMIQSVASSVRFQDPFQTLST